MYYKEWSSDELWLPDAGLCILPDDSQIPRKSPTEVQPFFDEDTLSKIETTLKKAKGYLERGQCHLWWEDWLMEAKKHMVREEPTVMYGLLLTLIHIGVNE